LTEVKDISKFMANKRNIKHDQPTVAAKCPYKSPKEEKEKDKIPWNRKTNMVDT
jgi:hypothetical protein